MNNKNTKLNRVIKTPTKDETARIAESLERIARALEDIASNMHQANPAFDPRWIKDPPYCPNPYTPPQYVPWTPVNPPSPTYTPQPPDYTYTYTRDTSGTRQA